MISYWLPVRILAYDVPHRIRSIDIASLFREEFDLVEGEYRKRPSKHMPAWAVVLLLLMAVMIAAEVKAALGR